MPSLTLKDYMGIYNIKEFGAQDGGNIYNALVAANARANGAGIVYIPPGSYTLGTSFSPSSGVMLWIAEGVTLSGSGTLSAGSGTILDMRAGFTLSGTLNLNGSLLKNVKQVMRKATVSGIAPSATADTYGTATDISPATGYYGLGPLIHIALTSGGTFGAETLTVRITATFSDTTTASVTKTFTATGSSTALTNEELASLMKDAVAITKLSVDCKSSIVSSTATGGAVVATYST